MSATTMQLAILKNTITGNSLDLVSYAEYLSQSELAVLQEAGLNIKQANKVCAALRVAKTAGDESITCGSLLSIKGIGKKTVQALRGLVNRAQDVEEPNPLDDVEEVPTTPQADQRAITETINQVNNQEETVDIHIVTEVQELLDLIGFTRAVRPATITSYLSVWKRSGKLVFSISTKMPKAQEFRKVLFETLKASPYTGTSERNGNFWNVFFN